MLASEGLTARALEGVAVSVGPGSYTGVRVGVTAAKTLGFALDVPVVAVESLRVIAANVALRDPACPSGLPDPRAERVLVVPVLDGRQRFLYGALYEVAAGRGRPEAIREVLPQSVDSATTLCRRVCRKVEEQPQASAVVVGDGAAAFLEVVGSVATTARFELGAADLGTPRARGVGLLAAPELRAAGRDREAVHRLEPLYLRATEAERRLAEAKQK